MTVLCASQDASVSPMTGSVWITEFHFIEWSRIFYARNRDHSDLTVGTTSCAVVIRQFGVKYSI